MRSALLDRAHQRGLVVHAYTFRNEVGLPHPQQDGLARRRARLAQLKAELV